MHEVPGIETLLDLHESILVQENGFWIKIEAWKVETSEGIPHGIRYSLTLHDADGSRVLGYDNAHAVKLPKKFKFAGCRLPYDHKHQSASDKGIPYGFKDAHQLMADFFEEADKVMKEILEK